MPSSQAASTIATTLDALLATGELLAEAQFYERSGMTPLQVQADVDAGRLFRLEVGELRGYPAFVLDPELDRVQVDAITQLLAGRPAGAHFAFFTTPRGNLATSGPIVNGVLTGQGIPRTPVQALRDGEFEPVKRAALSSMER